ncbi:hypothetical protein RN001_000551 [Aquatica leii]|uniref:Uncharacterized protein n=1 Tax=Aquatica leii TaxID=1421715 RepID=A0AAN7SSG8_9COLE|nr:hypothetical protein RN001_000551 [Aquatica leii]
MADDSLEGTFVNEQEGNSSIPTDHFLHRMLDMLQAKDRMMQEMFEQLSITNRTPLVNGNAESTHAETSFHVMPDLSKISDRRFQSFKADVIQVSIPAIIPTRRLLTLARVVTEMFEKAYFDKSTKYTPDFVKGENVSLRKDNIWVPVRLEQKVGGRSYIARDENNTLYSRNSIHISSNSLVITDNVDCSEYRAVTSNNNTSKDFTREINFNGLEVKNKVESGTFNKGKSANWRWPATSIFLNEHEERLLNIMGKSSYEGNPTNLEKGFRKRKLFITEDMPQVHSHTEDLLYDYTSTDSNKTLTQEITMPSTDLLTIDFPQSSSQLNVINSLTNSQDVVPVHKTLTSQLDITSQTNATTFTETPTNNTVKKELYRY